MHQLLLAHLEEVLPDSQLVLQLSQVGVHEGGILGTQLGIVRVLLVNVTNTWDRLGK